MERSSALVRLLADLVACDSANPPGNEEEVADYVAAYLAERGVASRRLCFAPGRVSLVAEIPGRDPGVFVLSGHLDTVAPAGLGWHTPPFVLTEVGDRLCGLGSCDMKGGVAVLIRAFLEVARRGQPRYGLRLLLSADEEGAYQGAAQFQREGLLDDAIFAVVAEPSGGRVLLGERGAFWVRLHFQGREAHGSTPDEGVNAALACVRFLTAIDARMRNAPDVPPFGPTTWNLGQLQGGRQPNIVPDACVAEIDFRLGGPNTHSTGDNAERDRIIAILEEEGARVTQKGGGFRWETRSWIPPRHTDASEPLVAAFRAAFAEIAGHESPVAHAPFCTDLPVLFPGDCPPFVIYGPGDIHQAHQPDEYVEHQDLEIAARVLTEFLNRAL